MLTTALNKEWITIGRDQIKFAKASGRIKYERGFTNRYKKGR